MDKYTIDESQYKKGYEKGYEDGKKDAVEVVRCKDCKHWCYEYDCVGFCTVDVPDIDGVQREDFDFCSYAERKENEQT